MSQKENERLIEREQASDVNDRLRREVRKEKKRNMGKMWLYIGVAVLILLLIIWLTIADFWGDTDVAADFIRPMF